MSKKKKKDNSGNEARKPFEYPLTKEEYKELEGYNGMKELPKQSSPSPPDDDDGDVDTTQPSAEYADVMKRYRSDLVEDVDDMMDMYSECLIEHLPDQFIEAVIQIHAELLTIVCNRFFATISDFPRTAQRHLAQDVFKLFLAHVNNKLSEVK